MVFWISFCFVAAVSALCSSYHVPGLICIYCT
jgi:hypothetical protein